MQIWKFPLKLVDGEQVAQMPRRAQVIHVSEQGGVPTLWATVIAGNPLESRRFHVVGTGHEFWSGWDYIGTAHSAPYVWHVFENTQEP